MWYPPQGHWPGFGELAKVNRLLPSQELNSTEFFKIPKILCARFLCMTSYTSTGQPFYRPLYYSLFLFVFCFFGFFLVLAFFVRLMPEVSVLFLVTIICLPLPFLSCLRVVVSMHWCNLQCRRVLSLLCFDTYSRSTSLLERKAFCIAMGFLFLWSILRSSSLFYFYNCSKHLTGRIALVFISWWDFYNIVRYLVVS